MKSYTKRIVTWVMAIALLVGTILTDYRVPLLSKAEENKDISRYVDVKLNDFYVKDGANKQYIVQNGEKQSENLPQLKVGNRVFVRYDWGVKKENINHITKDKYFQIELPGEYFKDALAETNLLQITKEGEEIDFADCSIFNNAGKVYLKAILNKEQKNYNNITQAITDGWLLVSLVLDKKTDENGSNIDIPAFGNINIKIEEKPGGGSDSGSVTPGKVPHRDPDTLSSIIRKQGASQKYGKQELDWYLHINRNNAVKMFDPKFKYTTSAKDIVVVDDLADVLVTKPKKDEKGEIVKDEKGEIVWETVNSDTYTIEVIPHTFRIYLDMLIPATNNLDNISWSSIAWPHVYEITKNENYINFDKKIQTGTEISWNDFKKSVEDAKKPTFGIYNNEKIIINFKQIPYADKTYSELYGGKDKIEEGKAALKDLINTAKEKKKEINSDQADRMEKAYTTLPILHFTVHFKTKFEGLKEGYNVKNKASIGEEKADCVNEIKYAYLSGGAETKAEFIYIEAEKKWKNHKGETITPDVDKIKITVSNDVGDPEKTFDLEKAKGWKGKLEEKLPSRKRINNVVQDIKYTLTEEAIPGYTMNPILEPVYDEATHTDHYKITNVKDKTTIDIPVEKIWSGVSGGELLPTEVKVKLFADGVEVVEQSPLILNATNHWKGSFEHLPEYKDNKKINYTIDEDVVAGYRKEIVAKEADNVSKGFTITNTKIPMTNITVTKEWLKRKGTQVVPLPEDHQKIKDITVYLWNATEHKQEGEDKVIGKGKPWTATFHNVPLLTSTGIKIEYQVMERNPVNDGFSVTGGMVNENGEATIKNILEDKFVNIKIKKVWMDEKDVEITDNTLKSEVVMQILHRLPDGKYHLDIPVIKMNNVTGWNYESTPLSELDEKGNKIKYQVQEIEVPEGYRATSKVAADGVTFTITNTKIPRKSIKIEKKWVDENNNPLAPDYEKIPSEIMIRLYANGASYKTVTLKKGTDWKGQFDDLPTADPFGRPIVYDVEELAVVDGFVPYKRVDRSTNTIIITNKKTEERVNLNISKKWVDVNNNPITDSNRLPDNISFKLFANGVSKGKLYVSKASGWNYTSGPLEKLDNRGKVINYTIEEDYVGGYTSTISKGADGYTFTVTNKENPTPPGEPYIPPYIPDEPIPTPPPNIPTPPAPDVPIDELVIEDDEVALADNEEEPEDPSEEITDDLPKVNKNVPKTADYLMDGFANSLAVGTVIMLGYGLKRLVAKKKKD